MLERFRHATYKAVAQRGARSLAGEPIAGRRRHAAQLGIAGRSRRKGRQVLVSVRPLLGREFYACGSRSRFP